MTSDDDPTAELEPQPEPEQPVGPIPHVGPRRHRSTRVGVALVTAAVVVVVLIGGAVAWASQGDDDASTATSSESSADGAAAGHHHGDAASGSATQAESDARAGALDASGGHHHQPLPPYAQRYDDATGDQQAAADQLLGDVRSTLAAYTDVDAAVKAGYRAPRNPRGLMAHYLNPSLLRSGAESGKVLDPAHPTGLVYFTGGKAGSKPILLGAFFVAPKNVAAPADAGDLVVWHSHSPECPSFFATKDHPCLETRRMLHVWTVDQVTLTGRRGKTATVKVTDPFGVPFKASVEKVGKTD